MGEYYRLPERDNYEKSNNDVFNDNYDDYVDGLWIIRWFEENVTDDEIVVEWTYATNEEYDRYWEAYLKDLPEVRFRLYATYNGPGFFGEWKYGCSTNFYAVIEDYYFQQYLLEFPEKVEVFEEIGWYEGWGVEALYSSRGELLYLYEEIEAYDKYLDEQEYTTYTKYILRVRESVTMEEKESPYVESSAVYYRNPDAGYGLGYATYFEGKYGEDHTIHVLLEEALMEYASYTATYRICMDEFTDEERREAEAASSIHKIMRFYKRDEHGEIIEEYLYEDITVADNLVSYGALYEALSRIGGYEVNGDVMHFSFTGIDGRRYECAYLEEVPCRDSTGRMTFGRGCYVAGERCAGEYGRFTSEEVYELTGLELDAYQ